MLLGETRWNKKRRPRRRKQRTRTQRVTTKREPPSPYTNARRRETVEFTPRAQVRAAGSRRAKVTEITTFTGVMWDPVTEVNDMSFTHIQPWRERWASANWQSGTPTATRKGVDVFLRSDKKTQDETRNRFLGTGLTSRSKKGRKQRPTKKEERREASKDWRERADLPVSLARLKEEQKGEEQRKREEAKEQRQRQTKCTKKWLVNSILTKGLVNAGQKLGK